jgi:hypothetical protein
VSDAETINLETESKQNTQGPMRLNMTDIKSNKSKNASLYITNETSPDRRTFIESQLSGMNTNNVSTNFQSPVGRGVLIPEINQLEERDDLMSTMAVENGIMSRYNEE